MITVLLRLAPDVEDRDLEEIGTEDDLKGALGGGEILMESTSQEIKTRAGRLAEDLRTYSKVIMMMVMVVMTMVVMMTMVMTMVVMMMMVMTMVVMMMMVMVVVVMMLMVMLVTDG
jgi:hypothetical protein